MEWYMKGFREMSNKEWKSLKKDDKFWRRFVKNVSMDEDDIKYENAVKSKKLKKVV
jgi:hypothetical protein